MGYNLLMLAYETRFVQKFLPDYSPDLSHLEIGSLDDIVDHTLERARSALASREKPVPNGEAEANQQ
ncbi:MAG: hypothetical protein U5N86_08755 [Planctomycetota bacterium]|nr:hypothetical protein [Planctomycetota bacterium]